MQTTATGSHQRVRFEKINVTPPQHCVLHATVIAYDFDTGILLASFDVQPLRSHATWIRPPGRRHLHGQFRARVEDDQLKGNPVKYITPEDHYRQQGYTDPAHRQLHVTPVSAPLYVVTAMFNPLRFASRYRLFHDFEKHVADAGAILYTVELALRDRHHEVTRFDNPHHIQLRGRSELWYKENLQNIGVRALPQDAEYIAFVDADFHFTRSDWATETVQMLQHHPVVQMFHQLSYETYDHRVHNRMDGFAYLNSMGQSIPREYGHKGAVGGALAFRRSALSQLGSGAGGPLLDKCILGSGDWHMIFALAMREDYHPEMRLKEVPEYVNEIRRWQDRAAVLKGDLGYVECHAIHHWHGPMAKRGYTTRPQILVNNEYNPLTDVHYDENGVLQLSGNKPKLRDQIRLYFKS